MSLSRIKPEFAPFPRLLISPSHLDDPIKDHIARHRAARWELEAIQLEEFDPRIPYGWGFFIYRAISGDGTDDRFAEGLNRLEKWLRWEAMDSRYSSEDKAMWEAFPDYIPAPGEPDITDEVAARMWNEVVEEYADSEYVITEPEGSEDFSPIGRDFASRVKSFNITPDLGGHEEARNTRYETCLIIDNRVLEMIEKLPVDTPSVAPHTQINHGSENAKNSLYESWIWILHRETAINREEGNVDEFPPWIRIRLSQLRHLFFMSAFGYVLSNWQSVVEEDKKDWSTVRWWSRNARVANEVRRAYRDGKTLL